MRRCEWAGNDPLYIKYHDEEWGKPNHDDRKHFEFIVLESAQAGLSWIIILRKRENYRKYYKNFDPDKVSKFGEKEIEEMMKDPGIIRYRRKIEASINNAKRFLEIQKEFGSFDKYIWSFVDNKPIVNHWESIEDVPSKNQLSDKISKDLKKRGFKFIGSTIIYSYLQAMGLINDHTRYCDFE
ncbi:MAG: DNA-3-methyladenine glycosylase I [Eubacteriales bacterium]